MSENMLATPPRWSRIRPWSPPAHGLNVEFVRGCLGALL